MNQPLCAFTVPADELARVLSNVSLVAKKSLDYLTVRAELGAAGVLTVSGTDGYCAVTDYCTGTYTGPDGGVILEIPREVLDDLEKAVRPDKREPVTVEWFPGDGLIVKVSTGRESARDAGHNPKVWNAVDELFALKESGPFELPDLCAIDMRLLARFWRVKSSTGTHVADWCFTGDESPILVKMGATFKALVMPIKRQVHAENFPDGLW